MAFDPTRITDEDRERFREAGEWFKADVKNVVIVCNSERHSEKKIIAELDVQYVKGRDQPPLVITEVWHSEDPSAGVVMLIRGEPQRSDPYENSIKRQDHLHKTGQIRFKVNLKCECGENIPIRSLEDFEEFLRIAIEADKLEIPLEIPLVFFRIAKLKQIKPDTPD